ncbi:MAG: CpsD/CapB family tyrosine-protein kinase [Clostridiaceae bacterium]
MKDETELITYIDPKSPTSEAYRTLRTNILFSSIDKEMKVFSVTSSETAEGKTTVISNLAITMAQAGQNVLILDCDLRKPNIHKIFKLENITGFTNVLVENVEVSSVINKIEGIDNLSVVTSGPIPPNPSELLNSKKCKELISEMKKQFDIILLDAPPVLVTDAAILSTIVDGIILVIGYGGSDIHDLKRTKEILEKVNAPIIGAVLNKIPMNNGTYKGYKYY